MPGSGTSGQGERCCGAVWYSAERVERNDFALSGTAWVKDAWALNPIAKTLEVDDNNESVM